MPKLTATITPNFTEAHHGDTVTFTVKTNADCLVGLVRGAAGALLNGTPAAPPALCPGPRPTTSGRPSRRTLVTIAHVEAFVGGTLVLWSGGTAHHGSGEYQSEPMTLSSLAYPSGAAYAVATLRGYDGKQPRNLATYSFDILP